MFDYWRGPIIFRFKVVRSQYHRGRLNINWDQRATSIGAIPNCGDASTMNVVLDLDESDEVEVEIPYIQAKPFLEVLTSNWKMPTTRTWENSSGTPTLTGGEYNGFISVKVMNRLTAPEATSDVDVLVFVRAGKGFQLAAPSEIDPNWTHSVKDNSVLQSDKVYTLGNQGDDLDVYKEVFGENITSIRELLHRSALSYNWIPYAASTVGMFNLVVPIRRYPRPPGMYDNAWDYADSATPGTPNPNNFSRMTHLNWVLPVFVGYKGSVNMTVNVVNNFNGWSLDRIEVCRRNINQSITAATRRPDYFTLANTLTRDVKQKQLNTQTKWGHDCVAGAALTTQKTNAGFVVNLPYYVNSKFLNTSPYSQYSNTDAVSNSALDWFELNVSIYKNDADNYPKGMYFQVFYASGPDFDVVFNLGCPMVFYKDRGAP